LKNKIIINSYISQCILAYSTIFNIHASDIILTHQNIASRINTFIFKIIKLFQLYEKCRYMITTFSHRNVSLSHCMCNYWHIRYGLLKYVSAIWLCEVSVYKNRSSIKERSDELILLLFHAHWFWYSFFLIQQ